MPVSSPPMYPLVVQHNALVNAQFSLSMTESRLFVAMLARISPQDTEFVKCQVEIHDIVESTSNNYAHVRKMVDSFGGCKLRIEKLSSDGRRRQKRIFTVIPLVEYAEYREGEGVVEAQFNKRLLPYLLELRDNFTKAQLAELIKIKSPSSFRIYWLLREYASFGKRIMPLEELKTILGLAEEYDRFNNFRVRVLDRAQKELADTDTAFSYKTVKEGREVVAIEFRFKHRLELENEAPPLVEWEEAVLATGVALSSLPQIKERLVAGDYELGYVRYVLHTVKGQVKAGKIKREGGAVFKALIEGYLLPAYHKEQQQQHNPSPAKPKVKLRHSPAVTTQLRRINSELEDAHNSLSFVKTAVIYTDETRAVALQEVLQRIAALEQQRQQLTA